MTGYIPSAALSESTLDRPDVRAALAAHDFGTVFFLARKWDGISYSKIAESCNVKPERVGRLARGEGSIVSFEKIAEIADGMRIPGSLLGLARRDWENIESPAASESAVHESDEVDRRNFLASSGLVVAKSVRYASNPIVEALRIVTSGIADNPDVTVDSLDELVHHYSQAVCMQPSAAIYGELLTVRSYVGTILDETRYPVTRHTDVVMAAGWLSGLLAIATSDMGDHAAALVWCSDAEHRSCAAGHPELAGWMILTRALIAYYRGQAESSVALASRGQAVSSLGTAAHARLASQEMRARAMLGDAEGMTRAREHAKKAIDALPPNVATTGAFSVQLAKDPPYTATSLLLVHRFQEAAEVTTRIITDVYRPQFRDHEEQPTSYARTLLVLALAQAGLRNLDEATAAGRAALEHGRPVWPTMVLAGRLDRLLMRTFCSTSETNDYHDRYVDATVRLSQIAARPEDGG